MFVVLALLLRIFPIPPRMACVASPIFSIHLGGCCQFYVLSLCCAGMPYNLLGC